MNKKNLILAVTFLAFSTIGSAQKQKTEQVKSSEKGTSKTVKAIDYDGAYILGSLGYYYLKPANTIYGRFGRCMGGFSDFNLLNTYFIESTQECANVSSTAKKITLSGNQYVINLSDYHLSELRDFSKDFGMCVWNLNTDKQYSFGGDKPVWTPQFKNNSIKEYITKDVRTKSINSNRAEIIIVDPLKKGNYYVLFNIKTNIYFIFYAK